MIKCTTDMNDENYYEMKDTASEVEMSQAPFSAADEFCSSIKPYVCVCGVCNCPKKNHFSSSAKHFLSIAMKGHPVTGLPRAPSSVLLSQCSGCQDTGSFTFRVTAGEDHRLSL